MCSAVLQLAAAMSWTVCQILVFWVLNRSAISCTIKKVLSNSSVFGSVAILYTSWLVLVDHHSVSEKHAYVLFAIAVIHQILNTSISVAVVK